MGKRHHCKKCGAAFSTEKGLKQHVKDKHTGYYYATRFIPLVGVLLVVALVALLFAQSPFPQSAKSNGGNAVDVLSGYLSGHENLATHIHVILKIYVDGKPFKIPAGIGILPDGRMRFLHTHDTSGTIHIEAPFKHTFKLGDFFKVWEKKINAECFDIYCGKVSVTVNGEPYDGDPRDLPLNDGDVIIINVLTLGTQIGSEASVGVEEGMVAPDFTAFTLDGQKITLYDFRGKVVLLWFMAVWCPSCAAVGPIIRDNQPQDAIVIVVDMWTEQVLREAGLLNRPGTPPPEEKEDLTRFIATYGDPNWLLVLDNYGLTKLYQLRYVDTTFVIGPDGKIILRSDGPISSNLLRFAISRAD